jgi:hypothetical protein
MRYEHFAASSLLLAQLAVPVFSLGDEASRVQILSQCFHPPVLLAGEAMPARQAGGNTENKIDTDICFLI